MHTLKQTIRRATRGASLAAVLVGLGALLPALPAQAQAGWMDWDHLGGARNGPRRCVPPTGQTPRRSRR
jgi:hypothetical protein